MVKNCKTWVVYSKVKVSTNSSSGRYGNLPKGTHKLLPKPDFGTYNQKIDETTTTRPACFAKYSGSEVWSNYIEYDEY